MKHYDLDPDLFMSPIVGLLHSMVDYNYQRLLRLVEGCENVIDYKGPDNDLNSIGQLLRHLTVVDLHWVYRLQGREIPNEKINEFGPMYDVEGKLPMIQGISLDVLLSEYAGVQKQLKDVCMRFEDEDLNNIVPFEKGNSASIRWGIWHVADHSRHHYSNIAYLKKLYQSQNPLFE
ncbi:DinB family protein [Saccharibacillus sacchari]|uniref:DinB family protein n=1 Tax=Saccharibacillus sacchari TaxID=456493 RepID=UPI003CC9A4E3